MKSNMRPAETENTIPSNKVTSMNRAQRRVFSRGKHIRGNGRAPRRTGQPEWFQRMKWESQRKRLLLKLPVSQLYDYQICTGTQVIALAEAGFNTIWSVVDAKYSELMKVPGFGPKTLAKFRQNAKIKGQLDMNWVTPDGR